MANTHKITNYYNASNYIIINKVNKRCKQGYYLDSIKYAEMREAIRLRLKRIDFIRKRDYDVDTLIIKDYNPIDSIIVNDYKKYPVVSFKKFLKLLHKYLSKALCKLDRAWGWYGIPGYGLNYGYNHIEKS